MALEELRAMVKELDLVDKQTADFKLMQTNGLAVMDAEIAALKAVDPLVGLVGPALVAHIAHLAEMRDDIYHFHTADEQAAMLKLKLEKRDADAKVMAEKLSNDAGNMMAGNVIKMDDPNKL